MSKIRRNATDNTKRKMRLNYNNEKIRRLDI